MVYISRELHDAVDTGVPPGDPQQWRMYCWGGTIVEMIAKISGRLFSCDLAKANEVLKALAETFGTEPVRMVYDARPESWRDDPESVPLKYQPVRRLVMCRDERVCETEVVHEFVHHWVSEALTCFNDELAAECMAENPGNPNDAYIPLTQPHGPIYMEAFILVCSMHFGLSKEAVTADARAFGLVVSDCDVASLKARFANLDLSQNTAENRDLFFLPEQIEKEAYLRAESQ